MPVCARSAALLPLLSFLTCSSLPALSQERPADPSFQVAQRGWNQGQAEDENKKREGKPQRARKDEKREAPPKDAPPKKADQGKRDERPRRDAETPSKARPAGNAERKNEKQRPDRGRDQARPKPQQQKQDDAAKAREAKQKREAEQAKQKAQHQKKQQDDAARARAAKQKQEADQAKQKAQQKQDAERAARQKQKDTQPKRDDRGGPREARPGSKDARPGDRRQGDKDADRTRKAQDPQSRTKAARPADAGRRREDATRRFEDVRKQRTERKQGTRNVIVEPDNRVIVRQKNRTIIRHDDNKRLRHSGREMRRERQKDGTWLIVTAGLAGALIYTLQDDEGRLLRRSRRDKSGRDMVLFDNRRHYYQGRGPSRTYDPYDDPYVSLPPPRVSIPRDQYILEYEGASADDIYDALMAPPVEELSRRYSLDEVRYSYSLLERMRRVDLDAVNFDFGSWDVTEDQYPMLERIADAIHRILEDSPDEVFLLEGHTDAVGSDVDNLSLSDRRAESVAMVLTDEFEIPPENLMTQGYGEYHLKVQTEEPSRVNRRVAIRRITPLLDREGWDDDVSSAP